MPISKAPKNTASDLSSRINSLIPRMIELRHDLHAHPQLAYQETYASEVVQRELKAAGIPFTAGLAETGVVGVIRCDHHDPAAKAIALRADMDALPITEATGLPYASKTPGLMHACGHDGHTAALLGTAHALADLAREHPEALPRPIKLIFQPAEEAGAGAQRMVEAGVLTEAVGGCAVESIFGLHGWTDTDIGQLRTLPGPMMAATLSFRITITGQGGHAASPHKARDPIPAAAATVTALQTIVSRSTQPTRPAVVTVATLHAGEGAVNVIPHTATLSGTARTFDLAERERIGQRIAEIARHTAAAHGCTAELQTLDGYPPTINDPAATDTMLRVARLALGDANVALMDDPVMGAEDFSFYAQQVPACFAFVGVKPPEKSDYPSLHTPEYDYADGTLTVSMKVLCALAMHDLAVN
ncbi:MAG: amidohydrolase [Phycisphaeraceae bacterium]